MTEKRWAWLRHAVGRRFTSIEGALVHAELSGNGLQPVMTKREWLDFYERLCSDADQFSEENSEEEEEHPDVKHAESDLKRKSIGDLLPEELTDPIEDGEELFWLLCTGTTPQDRRA